MSDIGFVLFSIVFILVLIAMTLLKNKMVVLDWERGLKIYIEDITYEEDVDER